MMMMMFKQINLIRSDLYRPRTDETKSMLAASAIGASLLINRNHTNVRQKYGTDRLSSTPCRPLGTASLLYAFRGQSVIPKFSLKHNVGFINGRICSKRA